MGSIRSPLQGPQLHGLHLEFVPGVTQEVVTADLVDLQVLRRLHESEHASLRIENGPWTTGPVVRGGLEFPHPEMVRGVGHHGVESRQVLGHRRGPVPTTDIRLIPFDLLRRPLQGNQGDLLLDPGLDIGSFGGSAYMLAPHDPRQRPVRPERSELVAVRAADDDQIAPGSMDESPAENLLPQVEPIGSRRREVVLRARVSTESGLEIALAIPQMHDDRVGVPPAPCGEAGSGPRGRLRPQGEPYRILVVAAESKRATVVPVRIEDRDASGPGPPGGDRVARPRFDTTQAGELSGPLTLPRPAVHVRTRLVKDAQLVRASVGDPRSGRRTAAWRQELRKACTPLRPRGRRSKPAAPDRYATPGGIPRADGDSRRSGFRRCLVSPPWGSAPLSAPVRRRRRSGPRGRWRRSGSRVGRFFVEMDGVPSR